MSDKPDEPDLDKETSWVATGAPVDPDGFGSFLSGGWPPVGLSECETREWIFLIRQFYHQPELEDDEKGRKNFPPDKQWFLIRYVDLLSIYLRSKNFSEADLSPLVEIRFSLEDAFEGRKAPLFTPHKRKRGTRYPAKSQRAWLFAALMITGFIKLGKSEDDAAKLVAKKLEQLRIDFPKKQVHSDTSKWQRLRDWREHLLEGRWPDLLNLYERLLLADDDGLPFDDQFMNLIAISHLQVTLLAGYDPKPVDPNQRDL